MDKYNNYIKQDKVTGEIYKTRPNSNTRFDIIKDSSVNLPKNHPDAHIVI
jgi:hypothetical protein